MNAKPATVAASPFAIAASHGPEAECIVHCVRNNDSSENDARIVELLNRPLDWARMVALGRRHAVLPLLHRKFSALGWERIPIEVRSDLETFMRLNAARNLAMVAELAEILKVGQDHDIPLIPFKGIVLGLHLYGDLSQRVSNDLDLLVRRHDAMKLYRLLGDRGYRSSWTLRPGYEQLALRSFGQLPLKHDRRPFQVEIHTELMLGPGRSETRFESLQSQLEPISMAGQTMDVLSSETMLLYLCAHGAKHCWERLAWLCDVDQLLRRRSDWDWPSVIARAQRLHWERSLYLGLTLTSHLFGTSFPEIVQARLPQMQSLAVEAAKNLVGMDHGRATELAGLRFQLPCLDRWRDRLWLTWMTTMCPAVADWQSVLLPVQLAFLHYLIRPLRLVGKYSTRLVRRSFRSSVAGT